MAIKKSFLPLFTALSALAPQTTLKSILENESILALMTAKKGGFTGEDSFIHIDNQKVARTCAMTGAIFTHDNTDKTRSFFYKNGSYMIGAEIVKANARKEWETERETALQTLEDQMMEGEINPKEWKEQATKIKESSFEFALTDEQKADLIETFDGYTTKEDYLDAVNNETLAPFTDYSEAVQALRDANKEEPAIEGA